MSVVNELPFLRLTPEHIIKSFDCGNKDINEFLQVDAKHYLEKLLAVTYLLETKDRTILYFTLSNDKISAIESEKSFFRKIKKNFSHSKHRKDYPAVKIGRLGVHREYKCTDSHWGTAVIDYIKHWMITGNKTGCRYITVDAYIEAVKFYIDNGFSFMGNAEKTRYEKSSKDTQDTFAMYFDLYNITTNH